MTNNTTNEPNREIESYTFYCTFGHGQPNFPGYFRVVVFADNYNEAEAEARRRMRDATNNRWCGLYNSVEDLHFQDNIFRGEA